MNRLSVLPLRLLPLALSAAAWMSPATSAQAATVTDIFQLKSTGKWRCSFLSTMSFPFNVRVIDGTTLTIKQDPGNSGDNTDLEATINNSDVSAFDVIVMKGRALRANKSGSTAEVVLSGEESGTDHFITVRGTAKIDKLGNITKVTGKLVMQVTEPFFNSACLGYGTFGTRARVGP